jgi:hypothetical protein
LQEGEKKGKRKQTRKDKKKYEREVEKGGGKCERRGMRNIQRLSRK